MKVSAQFNFRVDMKDEASPKVRTVKDDTKLKKVIKNEFFNFFQLDLIECDLTVTSKMKSYENGIRAMATLTIACKEEVTMSEIKKAIQVFVEVFNEKFRLESGDFEVYKIDVMLETENKCKPGYSKIGTKCYKDCKVGYTRNSKTMRCRKNK